jgi:hypothetical protein
MADTEGPLRPSCRRGISIVLIPFAAIANIAKIANIQH